MLPSLLLSLLVITPPALAQDDADQPSLTVERPKKSSKRSGSEIGKSKKWGIGLMAGYPFTFTAKYNFSPKVGISAHVGTIFVYHTARVQFEMEFYKIREWDFGGLALYWDAGITTRLWTNYLDLGVTGGAGVELKFNTVPAAVFVEANIQAYPFAFGGAVQVLGYSTGTGGRWYF